VASQRTLTAADVTWLTGLQHDLGSVKTVVADPLASGSAGLGGPHRVRTHWGFHCARTHSNRGFMGLQLVRRTRTVILMVPT
jgi:hypothetical protein